MDKGYHLTGSTGALRFLFSLCSFILSGAFATRHFGHRLSYIGGVLRTFLHWNVQVVGFLLFIFFAWGFVPN